MADAASVFDPMAEDYDDAFTRSPIGVLMRAAVHRRLAACFQPGQRVLELNCGTGEDALFLASRGIEVVASDASAAMLAKARDKAAARNPQGPIEWRHWRIEDLDRHLPREPVFHGVLSDFGGLNCVDDFRGLAETLSRCVHPGGHLLWCVMGRFVPWEWGWFGLRGQFRKAGRRLSGISEWRGLHIRYPLPSALAAEFSPEFHRVRLAGIGSLLPPSYAGDWLGRAPRLARALGRAERSIETLWPVPLLSDHYLLELERRQ